MNIYEILKYLPHRYPFLLVDRVLSCELDKSITVIKNVTINEPFFQGHFPVRPVMPGVLVIEAMAQAAGILSFRSDKITADKNTLYLFVGIDEARFKRPVEPGDQLVIEIRVLRKIRGLWKYAATATVDGEVCCTAQLMCTSKEFDK